MAALAGEATGQNWELISAYLYQLLVNPNGNVMKIRPH
jgi:hypothetical protein